MQERVAAVPGRPRVARLEEQQWLLDAVIRTVGVEWDQARLTSKSRPGGEVAQKDFRAAARGMKKFSHLHSGFAEYARRRQEKAAGYERENRTVAAAESYLAAALLWASAAWPIFEHSDTLLRYQAEMTACYLRFAAMAPHPVERVEIPFGDGSLPAYLHLPRVLAPGERIPCVISIGGMDGSKENMVAIHGDRFLTRGVAVLAVDGPGQGESITRGIFVTPSNFGDAGLAIHEYLSGLEHIDSGRIAIRASSFGSYFGTVAAAALGDRIGGMAATGAMHEPGCRTLFEEASPTYKARFMFMSGFEDEKAFDGFAEGIDVRRFAGSVTCPYLVIMGEEDQLSPLVHTERLFALVRSPKCLVVYEGANHGVSGARSADNGEDKNTLLADWLVKRIAGEPVVSQRIWVGPAGRPEAGPFEEDR